MSGMGKYIVYKDGGEQMLLIPNSLKHSDVRVAREDIISAGHFNIIPDDDELFGVRIACFGESDSLGMKSRPEKDSELAIIQYCRGH